MEDWSDGVLGVKPVYPLGLFFLDRRLTFQYSNTPRVMGVMIWPPKMS
jgi:hypothetical protein